MPKLNDHGLGGGGKSVGVPVYPLNGFDGVMKDITGDVPYEISGENTTNSPVNISGHASCVVDDNIYFIGTATDASYCYRYNVTSKVWTKLNSEIDSTTKYWAVPIGTDIYYLNNNSQIFKYNILTNRHSHVIATPTATAYSYADTDGVDLYIYGSSTASYYQRVYRLEIASLTFVQLTDAPFQMCEHSVQYGGNGNMYLFGGAKTGGGACAYKHTIENDTYTQLSDVKVHQYKGTCTRIDYHIFMAGSSANSTAICVYNILTDVSITLSNLTDTRMYGHIRAVNDVLYIIGGTSARTTGNTRLVIWGDKTKILTQNLIKNIKVYTDGEVISDGLTEVHGTPVIDGGTTLEKTNGAVRIPNDGEYAIVGANYATIGG